MMMRSILIPACVAAMVSAGTTLVVHKALISRELVDVPTVLGLPLQSARGVVESKGLLFLVIEEREDAKVPAGHIVIQRPMEGSKVGKGDSLSVVVAKAPSSVNVPDLVGRPLPEARLHLESAKLAPGNVTETTNETVAPGIVLAHSPAAGTEAPIGSTVDLTVSQKSAMVAVPNVMGRGLTKAKEELQKAGLTLGTLRTRADDDRDDGIVLEQIPAAGQQAPKGSPVDLVVNRP